MFIDNRKFRSMFHQQNLLDEILFTIPIILTDTPKSYLTVTITHANQKTLKTTKVLQINILQSSL